MELIDKIIDDSALLIRMRNNEPEFFINITTEKLSAYINNMNNPYLTNIIDRIKPLYEEDYPPVNMYFIQLLKDLDFLESKKRIDLFVLIHFSLMRYDVLKGLNDTINYEYKQIKFKDNLKGTCMLLGLVDILKLSHFKFKFSGMDFVHSCEYGHLEVVQYIYNIGEINIHFSKELSFRSACRSGNLEIVKWLLEIEPQINIHIHNDLAFVEGCKNGNITLVKFLFELGLRPINELFNITEYSEEIQSFLNT